MAGLNFEGDLSGINEHQLKYITSAIEKLGYTNSKVTVEPVGKAGDNYMANVKRIIIEGDNGRTLKMVAKIAPSIEMLRKMSSTENIFLNEHIMYTQVLPKLTQYEIAADVPPKERLRYAACYGSSNDPPNEVILLEDLKESNFTMVDRMKPISVDSVKSVLKNFALLHSLSYALKYKEPELFEEYKNGLFDAWVMLSTSDQLKMHFKQLEENSVKIVDDTYKKAIDGALMRSFQEVGKMAKYEKHSKHAIIQQGDAWTNNIMFNFDGDNVLESVMIDYQGSKASNPAADLLYMIFNCTNHQMRKDHFYDWIDYYHTELDKSLHNYGLKASLVFPRDQLDVDLKRYGKISFGLSLLLTGALSMKSEEAGEIKKRMEEDDPEKLLKAENISDHFGLETVAIMKQRLEELVDSYQEFGLI